MIREVMLRRIHGFAVAAIVSALLSGCGFDHSLKSFPPYPDVTVAGNGAVLLSFSADTQLPGGFFHNSVLIGWPGKGSAGDPSLFGDIPYYRFFPACGPGQNCTYSGETALVSLPPGRYSRTVIRFFFIGHQGHWTDIELIPPKEFVIERGKVTVLGRFHLTAKVELTGETENGVTFNFATKLHGDYGPEAATSLLQEAAARSDQASLQWRPALEAAQAAIQSAGP